MGGVPDCFDCKYGGLEHPCRTAQGGYDFAKVAAAMVARGRSIAAADRAGVDRAEDEAVDWVVDCEYEAIEDHPCLLPRLMVAAADACETAEDAAFIAAGLYENAIVKHGPKLIDTIEALAARSPKFSYILSGIWSQNGSVDADVWRRIGRAVARHPRMDADGRGPHDGGPVVVLAEREVGGTMAENVAAAARDLL
jgi:hypothetical protein